MILYFSGTGNSRHAAELIHSVTGGDIISINDIIKNSKPAVFDSELPYVIVCPTYAWRVPRIVEEFIMNAEFKGNKRIYFVLTCGDSAGDAWSYAKELAHRKKLIFKGLRSVVMPENYIALFSAPSPEKAEEIIQKADKDLLITAKRINNSSPIRDSVGFGGKILSRIANPFFYSFIVKADGFKVSEQCISCGKCVEVCPLNNITLEDGRPVWGKNCTHCMACICLCPQEAIDYKNKTVGKQRYHFDDIDETEDEE